MKAESSTNSRAAARRAAHAATSLTPMPPEEIWKGMAKYMHVNGELKWRKTMQSRGLKSNQSQNSPSESENEMDRTGGAALDG